MVSYYNSALTASAMFSPAAPPHHPASSAAARHAPQHSPAALAAASAVAAQNAYFSAGYPTPYASQQFQSSQYSSDLNSNMYGMSSTPSFPSGFESNGATPTWHAQTWAHQFASSTPPSCRSYWPPSAADIPTNNQPQQQQQSNEVSATTEPQDSSPRSSDPAAPSSPAYAGGGAPSHSSGGSPSGTPTPGYHYPPTTKYPYPHSPPDGSDLHLNPSEMGGGGMCAPQQQDGESDGVMMNSHGVGSPLSPNTPSSRPQPARSPYEWMKKPSYQQQPEKGGRTRTKDKYRVVYSDHQRLELEKEFHYSRYITIRRKAELANSVGLSERQVKIWFQNRRAKERRQLKKHDDVIAKEKLDPCPAPTAFDSAVHAHFSGAGMTPYAPPHSSIAMMSTQAPLSFGNVKFESGM